jgi:hypothetical protein
MTTPSEVESDRCPVCRMRLLVRSAADIVIRNAILRVDGATGRVTAKCARCKAWVDVPLRFVG